MRYDLKKFNDEVKGYKSRLKNIKTVFVYGEYANFYSFAPFSKACSELGVDLHVLLCNKQDNYGFLFDIWNTYENLKNNIIGKKERLLNEILDEINIDDFKRFFERPDLILDSKDLFFIKSNWFRPFMKRKLRNTTKEIIKNVYALKKTESFSIGFVTIPKNLAHPIQDYLDSYVICHNMFLSSKYCKCTIIKSSTERTGMLDEPQKVSELVTTFTGLELEKDLPLPIFRKYKKLSDVMKFSRIIIPKATFFISTKGYHGRHYFGERIGYTTKNMKDKWTTPGQMINKFNWYPQSKNEERDPKSRVAFTSTVPIERLVESCLIDYNAMRRRNHKIKAILDKCDTIYVKSDKYCNFEVLLKKDNKRRMVMGSDSDVRTMINPQVLKETKKRMGRMANIPGGEAFTTPFFVRGKIVGDVVINIDKSYMLDKKKPIVALADEKGYKIISGPKRVLDALEKKKKEAWNNILEQEKNCSLSKDIIELKKKNFNNIGEFAINTNPNAKLCDYLIINEKIANMIHVAFGSGFEPDMVTEYHMDVVIDAPRQKLDIYGIGKKQYWILKKGKFCV